MENQHRNKQGTVLATVLLWSAATAAQAAPASNTVTTVPQLEAADGKVIINGNKNAITINNQTADFIYQNDIDATVNGVGNGIHIQNSKNVTLGNTNIKIETAATSGTQPKGLSATGNDTKLNIDKLTINVNAPNLFAYGVWGMTNSEITANGPANIKVTGKQVYGIGAAAGTTMNFKDQVNLEVHGAASQTYGVRATSGNSQITFHKQATIKTFDDAYNPYGVHVDQAQIDFLDKAYIHTTASNPTAVATSVNLLSGGKVYFKDFVHISATGGKQATALYVSRAGAEAELNGGIIEANQGGERHNGTAIKVRDGSLLAKKNNYQIYGDIKMTGGTGHGMGGTADINFQGDASSRSYFKGSATKKASDTLNLSMEETTWDMTGDSQVSTLHFADANSKVNFVAKDTAGVDVYSKLDIDTLSGNGGLFNMRTSVAENKGDYINITTGSGSHKIAVKDSGVEITDPVNTSLDLVTDKSKGASFALASPVDGTNINAVDGGTYMYFLKEKDDATGKVWYLSADPYTPPVLPIDPTSPINPPRITTPATDAIFSMAIAPQLIMSNAMSNLRFRKGRLRSNEGNAGVWSRMIADRTDVDKGHANFKLKQYGFELGADKALDVDSGRVFIGVHGGYTASDIEHARKGTSDINSYSVGAYATYFADNGIYVDGVLQYNHFDNKLKAVSTQGYGVQGKYAQNGYGASVEVGYDWQLPNNFWAEPYGKLSYIRVGGKDVLLSNGMFANIESQDSFRSELGISAGKDITLKSQTILSPYVKLAWSHEFKKNNQITINHFNRFKTDLSGDYGKVGIGLDAKVKENLSFFGELDYRKGSGIESPVQANIGLRYHF